MNAIQFEEAGKRHCTPCLGKHLISAIIFITIEEEQGKINIQRHNL